uniref:Uncharacterized protein n=1 Tax=Anguilla anguilla TaxID=7936 RepID=A0A0E9U2D4_ANGAN
MVVYPLVILYYVDTAVHMIKHLKIKANVDIKATYPFLHQRNRIQLAEHTSGSEHRHTYLSGL